MEASRRDIAEVTIIDLAGSIRANDDFIEFTRNVDNLINQGRKMIALNFGEVNFINSSGLGRLVMAAKLARECGGSITIYNLTDDLTELFSFTRLDSKISVHKTEEGAVKALRQ